MSTNLVEQTLSDTLWKDHQKLFALSQSHGMRCARQSIRTIALSYTGLKVGGGAERVMVRLAEIFHTLGYNVVIFTTTMDDAEYPVPVGVERITLPQEKNERISAIDRYIQRFQIDLWIFNEHTSIEAFYCMAYLKLMGVRTAVICHGVIFFYLHFDCTEFLEESAQVFKNLDAVICLDESNAIWWRAMGCENAVRINNPLTFKPEEVPLAPGHGKSILFAARLSQTVGHDKGTFHVPKLVELVAREVPGVEFVIAGGFDTQEDEIRFLQEVSDRSIEPNVKMKGWVSDISPLLSESNVLVMLSNWEGNPMIRLEAFAHGVPAVIFEMDYLEPNGPESGCVSVPKGDVESMAAEVVRLLRDKNYWTTLSGNARDSLGRLGDDVIGAQWEKLFISICNDSVNNDFALNKKISYDFVGLTLRESIAGLRTAVSLAKSGRERYAYLKPVHKLVEFVIPSGTRRRTVLAGIYSYIHRKLHQRRMKRRKRRDSAPV